MRALGENQPLRNRNGKFSIKTSVLKRMTQKQMNIQIMKDKEKQK